MIAIDELKAGTTKELFGMIDIDNFYVFVFDDDEYVECLDYILHYNPKNNKYSISVFNTYEEYYLKYNTELTDEELDEMIKRSKNEHT